MSLIAIRADVAERLAAYRADQRRPEDDRRPIPEPAEYDQTQELRGMVRYGEPARFTDGTNEWWCYDDDRWPASPPTDVDGNPVEPSGSVRVYSGIPDGWTRVEES